MEQVQEQKKSEDVHSCCGSERHKKRSPEEIRSLTNRLSRIEGQIRGSRSMGEGGAYCPDILVQSSAVTAAMNAFNKELLASHIRTCVAEDIRAGDDATIDELVRLLQKLMKLSALSLDFQSGRIIWKPAVCMNTENREEDM